MTWWKNVASSRRHGAVRYLEIGGIYAHEPEREARDQPCHQDTACSPCDEQQLLSAAQRGVLAQTCWG